MEANALKQFLASSSLKFSKEYVSSMLKTTGSKNILIEEWNTLIYQLKEIVDKLTSVYDGFSAVSTDLDSTSEHLKSLREDFDANVSAYESFVDLMTSTLSEINSVLNNKADLIQGTVPENQLPIASTSDKGISKFDSQYFSVSNGNVTFNNTVLDPKFETKANLINDKVPEEELPEASNSKKGIASYDSNDFVVSDGVVQISRALLDSFSDVIYSSSLTNLPNPGRINALYIVGNLLYRWNGSSYVKMITESTGGGTGGNTGSTEGGFVLDANNNLVFGENNTFNGDTHNCVVIGDNHELSAWMSKGLIVGRGHKADVYNPEGCVLLGNYAKSADYIQFAVGVGSGPDDRRNAIEVTSEGKVYINDVYVGGGEDSPGDSVEEPHLVFSGDIYINNTVNGIRLDDKPHAVQIDNPADSESGTVLISNIFTKNTFELFGHKMSLQYEIIEYDSQEIPIIYFNVPDLEYSSIAVRKIYELW